MIIQAHIWDLKPEEQSKLVLIDTSVALILWISFSVSHLLTDGLSGGIMHHTPWSVPVCHDFADLPFSMYAFDHLVGVQYRDKFEFLPEPQIRSVSHVVCQAVATMFTSKLLLLIISFVVASGDVGS